ncbi:MAG: glycosyltransferase, partial [Candidatus Lokiarchaeota archaeon]|nr:glycosyltransferase [Candidatus Lokiarchaeota archaeon]
MKLSVIIPVYNERETLPLILERINTQPFNMEIVIVDDFSTDGTREYIESLSGLHYMKLFHDKNQGKGAAVRTAQEHIEGDIVIIQDADLEYQPEDFETMIRPIRDGGSDVV